MTPQLRKLEKKITYALEDKYQPVFRKQAKYFGNGIYGIAGLTAKDTRELFVLFVAKKENIS